MLTLQASPRKMKGRKTRQLRMTGFIPAVLYGPGKNPLNLQVRAKEFREVYREAGESSLVELGLEGDKKTMVLISQVQLDPISHEIIHIDFFAPKLTEKIEAKVPIIFEGEAPAVKEGGTLIKNIQELQLKALPQNLPKELVVPIGELRNMGDKIRIKDLLIPQGTEIIGHSLEEIVVQILVPEKIEEELAKPIEEKVEEVEKVEKPKKEEVPEEPQAEQ